MVEKRQRRTFDKEFKKQTVQLIVDGHRPLKAIARELNINPNVLRNWKREYINDQENAFPGKGYLRPEDEELHKLRKELVDLREENAILKKVLAIFSKPSK